ncbi:MAG: hypothetical protein HY901_25345 [Deltaproteobacteria bacterium]|nr:hypothetical protein [Deltaproteobacteria bacterium]
MRWHSPVALLLSLLACDSANRRPAAPNTPLGTAVEQLAARDPVLDRRILRHSTPWTVTVAGEVRTAERPRGLAQITSRLAQHADGRWETSLGESHRLALVPRGARAARVEVEGKRAIYRDAYLATDVVMVSGVDFAEQLLVLHGPEAPATFAWDLEVPAGLFSARRDASGGLVFLDDRGRELLRMPRPFAVDGQGVRRDAALDWDGKAIAIHLDRQGLAYPVLLDPVIEVVTWLRLPRAPLSGSMACLDSSCVLFEARYERSETWTFDGVNWTLQSPSVEPPTREYPSLARYGDKVIMFGGERDRAIVNETWEWDGTIWRQRFPATSPPACKGAGRLAARGSRLVFLGCSRDQPETWEWDGNNWTQLFPARTPTTNSQAHSFDLASYGDKVVLFNGETWEWDGIDWASRATPAGLASAYASLAEYRAKLVLFGESVGTWEWDGSSWTLLSPPLSTNRFAYGGVMRHLQDLLVRFKLDETLAWDGTSWTQILANPYSPCGRSRTMVTVDGRAILFEGFPEGEPDALDASIYQWVGKGWQPRRSGAVPPPRLEGVGAAQASNFILFGGGEAGEYSMADTWVWDRSMWTEKQVSPSPRGRTGHSMSAYGDKVLLFGGTTGSSETWEWNGSTWTQMHPAVSPPPRFYGAMTDLGGSVLLYGGTGEDEAALSDTWEWDGAEWRERIGILSPGPSNHPLLAGVGGRAVLWLGFDSPTWEWNGTHWQQTATVSPSDFDMGPTMARDGDAVLFNAYGETWAYRPFRLQGSDCSDSSQCLTGYCIDGVCCDKSCKAQCEACDLPASLGSCRPVLGAPHGARPTCASDGPRCGGACDGQHREDCVFPGTQTLCVAAACGLGVANEAAFCDGAGACLAAKIQSCAPYSCLADRCLSSCTSDSECAPGHRCASASCIPTLALGQACDSDATCTSGHCSDGLCCESSCDGACVTCKRADAPGQCLPVEGEAPVAGHSRCESGRCSGGTCVPPIAQEQSDGCGCSASGVPLAGPALLLLVSGFFARRRRFAPGGR